MRHYSQKTRCDITSFLPLDDTNLKELKGWGISSFERKARNIDNIDTKNRYKKFMTDKRFLNLIKDPMLARLWLSICRKYSHKMSPDMRNIIKKYI